MTKKHYEAIAAIINAAYTAESDIGIIKDIAYPLADYFATDNKNFNRTRFLAACGIVVLDTCWCGSSNVHTHE